LKPRSQRKLSADQLVQKLRGELNSIPGMRVYLQNPPPIPLGGRLSKSQYQFTLQSYNLDELQVRRHNGTRYGYTRCWTYADGRLKPAGERRYRQG
jgi:multidrug efflux pump subunit AcrB